MRVTDLVNLDAYPIQDIESPVAQTLVTRCRQDLDKSALCTLEQFVSSDALMAMKSEIKVYLVPGPGVEPGQP